MKSNSIIMTMSWCRKATILTRRSFLNSHFLHTPNSGVPKSIGITSYVHMFSRYAATIQPSTLFFYHRYATEPSSNRIDRRVVNGGMDENNAEKVEVQIISRESIKPASPTPRHLRTFKLSIIDQFYLDYYSPLVLFLPNSTDNPCIKDVIPMRSRRLKESLSDLLTRYYPFAGEIKDNLHIECNDKGVTYVEARVNQTLEEFLQQPDDQKVRELIPTHPSTTESSLGKHVASVQVNIFNCGGIGLGTSMSHKIVDGQSYITFMKAWAAAARGSPEKISPSFVASEVFPNNPSLEYSIPSKLKTSKVTITKRFVFDSTALASLKSQTVATTATPTSPPSPGPTRVEAITALIWKAAASAACTVRPFSLQSPHVLCLLVDLRKRASPPLPNESIGNLIDAAIAVCFPKTHPELPTLMNEMRESIAKKNLDFIESIKGEKGLETFSGLLRTLNGLFDVIDEGDCLVVTSLLNSGIYEVDFGWGKPVWFYRINPGAPRILSLNDMVKGNGVEAIVSLSPQEMEIFERHPDILSFTTVNPSPLQFLG